MRTCVLAIIGVICLGGAVRAQDASQTPPARPIAETAERLARELWPLEVTSRVDQEGRPRFRANITETQIVLPPLWGPPDKAWIPVPPRGSIYHQEFLAMVTPEAFRASTLYPMGIGVDPGAIFQGLKQAWGDWQEERVRKRVERELAEFLARVAAQSTTDNETAAPTKRP